VTKPAAPARGTRPGNRRQLIIEAAAELFARKGYAHVGMSEVAEAVGIGPSALYRHFRSKHEILAVVVAEALDTLREALTAGQPGHLSDIAETLATLVLRRRVVGVLWQREARQLSRGDRARFRADLRQLAARLADLLQAARPGVGAGDANLLAWSALAVATSVSLHTLVLPEPEFTTLLSGLTATVLEADIPTPIRKDPPEKSATLGTLSRRESILAAATKLFAAQGYAQVSTDDIGASVGISGPGVYNHFPAKSDILVAAMLQGDEWLRMDMQRAFARATDTRDGLRRLLTSYCCFVFDNPYLVQVLVSESTHLPDDDRHRTRAAQHAYIAEWVNLVRQVHPQWDALDARIRVQAVQTMMNDVALNPSLRSYAGVEAALIAIGAELLMITDPN